MWKRIRPFVRFLILLLILIGGLYFVLFTTAGSDFVTRLAIARFFDSKEIVVGAMEGTVVEGFSLNIKRSFKRPAGDTIIP